jgi:hypothetical protein
MAPAPIVDNTFVSMAVVAYTPAELTGLCLRRLTITPPIGNQLCHFRMPPRLRAIYWATVLCYDEGSRPAVDIIVNIWWLFRPHPLRHY